MNIIVGCDNSGETLESVLTTTTQPENHEKETYLVGTAANYPPLEFRGADGQLIGLEIDMISAVAQDQGFDITILPMRWGDIMPSLDAGTRDIGMALWYSDERAEKYDFSVPLYSTKLVMARLKNKAGANSVDDINNAQIALQGPDTLNHRSYTKVNLDDESRNNKLVMTTRTYLAFKSLVNGDSDYILDTDIQLRHFIKNSPLTMDDFVFIYDDRFASGTWAYAVKKGNRELLDKINNGIKNLRKSGEYQKIVSKWFK
ncbi:MAG: hypothetical protein CSA42_00165 [Gammaproteobacteria bacterium]|nr:MAG: hypothetical protein CSA42_00165 [Gammaproteobacteria bacterium]